MCLKIQCDGKFYKILELPRHLNKTSEKDRGKSESHQAAYAFWALLCLRCGVSVTGGEGGVAGFGTWVGGPAVLLYLYVDGSGCSVNLKIPYAWGVGIDRSLFSSQRPRHGN